MFVCAYMCACCVHACVHVLCICAYEHEHGYVRSFLESECMLQIRPLCNGMSMILTLSTCNRHALLLTPQQIMHTAFLAVEAERTPDASSTTSRMVPMFRAFCTQSTEKAETWLGTMRHSRPSRVMSHFLLAWPFCVRKPCTDRCICAHRKPCLPQY